MDKVKRDHEQRIGELQKAQGVSEQKAELIILNAEEVDAAIAVIRSALAQSIDWTELKRVVKVFVLLLTCPTMASWPTPLPWALQACA